MDPMIGVAIFVLALPIIVALLYSVVAQVRETKSLIQTSYNATSRHRASPGERSSQQSPEAEITALRSALASREETIKDLREKGGRAVADRDRWEAAAKTLQLEISSLKNRRTPAGGIADDDFNNFRELTAGLAKNVPPRCPQVS
jgi:hypothetical protein